MDQNNDVKESSGNHIPLMIAGVFIALVVVFSLIFFIIPGVKKSQKESNLNLCYNNIKRLSVQLDSYKKNEGKYPNKLDKLVPEYFKGIPTCPELGANTYSDGYSVSTGGEIFTLYCRGNHHTDMGIPPNFPFYASEEGLVRKR